MNKKEIQKKLKKIIKCDLGGLVSDGFDYTIVYNYANKTYDVIDDYYDEMRLLDDKEIVDTFFKVIEPYLKEIGEQK